GTARMVGESSQSVSKGESGSHPGGSKDNSGPSTRPRGLLSLCAIGGRSIVQRSKWSQQANQNKARKMRAENPLLATTASSAGIYLLKIESNHLFTVSTGGSGRV